MASCGVTGAGPGPGPGPPVVRACRLREPPLVQATPQALSHQTDGSPAFARDATQTQHGWVFVFLLTFVVVVVVEEVEVALFFSAWFFYGFTWPWCTARRRACERLADTVWFFVSFAVVVLVRRGGERGGVEGDFAWVVFIYGQRTRWLSGS